MFRAAMLLAAAAGAAAPEATSAQVVEGDPCPHQQTSDIAAAFAEWMIQTDPDRPLPEVVDLEAERRSETERGAKDWANLCRWRNANRDIRSGEVPRPEVVFIGDSITENWALADPEMFDRKATGRGVSGQTTAQILVRFPEDVLSLQPELVHIMAGTNDIAGNGGPTTLEQIENRIAAMAYLARAHGIRVVIASVPPAADFFWNPGLQPAPAIRRLNERLKDFARENHFGFVDHYSALVAPTTGAVRRQWSNDGVHPNRNGYAVMKPLAEAALLRAAGECTSEDR